MRRSGLITAMVLSAAVAGCGGGDETAGTASPVQRGRAGDAIVARYCAYDTKSHSAIIGCFESTSPFQVAALKTNAAKYARGEIGCKADAGPFCN